MAADQKKFGGTEMVIDQKGLGGNRRVLDQKLLGGWQSLRGDRIYNPVHTCKCRNDDSACR